MNKKQLKEWQEASVKQAYDELEADIMVQWAQFIPPNCQVN